MMKIILIIFLIVFDAAVPAQSFAEESYPSVLPLKQEITFDLGPPFAAATYIFGTNGEPLYLIECHDYSAYSTDFDYSGDFDCRLVPLKEKTTYSTLFTEELHPTTDWEGSRARYFGNEVKGKCALYPDYGAVREFRLRGMKITLAMHNIVFQKKLPTYGKGTAPLQSFHFVINVVPDSAAASAITAPSAYLPPQRVHPSDQKDSALDCSTVKKR